MENLNANIVAFGGAILGINFINNIVDEFINTKYKPNPEKEELIAKIDKLSEVSPDVAANDHIFDEENDQVGSWGISRINLYSNFLYFSNLENS